jgi:hypothetical protein
MIKTLWIAIEANKIKAMWNKDCTQSFKSWRKAVKTAYPKSSIRKYNIIVNAT